MNRQDLSRVTLRRRTRSDCSASESVVRAGARRRSGAQVAAAVVAVLVAAGSLALVADPVANADDVKY